jgi:2-polyprenyl-3-methyl-5-hydroxy-6-metoxy-1,4-benzoquinol methylase
MKPNYFIKEAYRRMSIRAQNNNNFKWEWQNIDNFLNQESALVAEKQYIIVLPKDKNAKILDIGFGDGWFMAACVRMGYTNIYGADFFAKKKAERITDSCEAIKEVFDIEESIGDFLLTINQKFDYIHMSHVIEHIPKHYLFYHVDALYRSLEKDGILLLRTPNMESPRAMSSLFVTLTHEYGFSDSNLYSLLYISGFDEICFHNLNKAKTIKQLIGKCIREPFLFYLKIKNRLFGVNHFGQYDSELIVTARKKDHPGFFNEEYK